jgi:hypothetical protein
MNPTENQPVDPSTPSNSPIQGAVSPAPNNQNDKVQEMSELLKDNPNLGALSSINPNSNFAQEARKHSKILKTVLTIVGAVCIFILTTIIVKFPKFSSGKFNTIKWQTAFLVAAIVTVICVILMAWLWRFIANKSK